MKRAIKTARLIDICKATGLSKATVSRVINKSPKVNERTRKRVLDTMEELNYTPLPSARALAGHQRAMTLGVVTPYVSGGFLTETLLRIDQVACEHEYHVLTAFGHSEAARPLGLTTVRVPFLTMGRLAAERALAMIDDPEAGGNNVMVPTELIIRQSCGTAGRAHTTSGRETESLHAAAFRAKRPGVIYRPHTKGNPS